MPLKGHQRRIFVLPGICRQAGLATDLFQETLGIQVMLDGNSRKQKPMAGALGDSQAVLADDHGISPRGTFAPETGSNLPSSQTSMSRYGNSTGEIGGKRQSSLADGNGRVLDRLAKRYRLSE